MSTFVRALAKLEQRVADFISRTAPAKRDEYDLGRLTAWERWELALIEPWSRDFGELSDGELDTVYGLLRNAAREAGRGDVLRPPRLPVVGTRESGRERRSGASCRDMPLHAS